MKESHILYNLLHHTKTDPHKIALYLLNNDDLQKIDNQMTYQALLESVVSLSETLKKHTKPCDRVMLCYPTGLDFIVAFYACLLAKVIAVAVTVPSNAVLLNKFLAIYEDCQPTLLLTDSPTKALCETSIEKVIPIIASDALIFSRVIDVTTFVLPTIMSDDIAFLQYTSGSTANPKGVMISHGNLLHNIVTITVAFNSKPTSVGVNWLPHTHDMGLIGSFLHSVYMGATLYLMSPFTIIRRPIAWLQALSKYRATITGGPCFMLKMCMDHLNAEKMKTLDLRALEYIIVGSEPINEKVVSDFFNTLASVGLSPQAFAPAYGLAEATLMVSARTGLQTQKLVLPTTKMQANVISCGKPYQTVKIVSPDTTLLCNEGDVGEIWIDGESLARGYWQKSQETQQAFQAELPGGSQHYFRSGDLGYIHHGELYVVGRIKDVIIINGVNYYPEDIERTIMACDELMQQASCVVFRWRLETHLTDHIIVLVRASKRISIEQQETLSIVIKKQLLKDYQIIPYDLQFVPFSLPKTTSGKLQRHECESLYIKNCTQRALLC